MAGWCPCGKVRHNSKGKAEAHLRALVSALRGRGIAPVLATYPTLGTGTNRDRYRLELLDARIWSVELSDLGMLDAAARLNDATRRVAAELRVPLADADVAVPKSSAYFADYVHYTDAGAERVAEAVLAALERGGLLDGGRGRFTTTGSTDRPR